MPLSDYADGVGGGLKLKGVKDGRVKKSKKKSKKDDSESSLELKRKTEDRDEDLAGSGNGEAKVEAEQSSVVLSNGVNKYGKTEAQLRHEERRRQMREEKTKKEGTKTHKEKVEELNKYLSRLSEHHDMPKIGPG